MWSGQYVQGVEHGKRAIRLLERAEERWWQGQSYWVVEWNYGLRGELALALEAVAQAFTIGETIGDLPLEIRSSWSIAWIQATQGESEAAIEACRRCLERSSDILNTATALAFLGYANLEKGDANAAIPLLEQAVQDMNRLHYRQVEGWFTAYLSEAYLLTGQHEKAREIGRQALEIARGVRFSYAVGLAQSALGRIALASGDRTEAETNLHDALQTFDSIQARYELARTHLELAKFSHAQGNHESTAVHLNEAHGLFKELQVPKWTERATQLADELGVSLAEGGN